MRPLPEIISQKLFLSIILGIPNKKQSAYLHSPSIPYEKRKIKMRARLYVLCVVVVLAALIGCNFDFSGLMLSSDPVIDEPVVSEIPDEIKELIWQDYEALLNVCTAPAAKNVRIQNPSFR